MKIKLFDDIRIIEERGEVVEDTTLFRGTLIIGTCFAVNNEIMCQDPDQIAKLARDRVKDQIGREIYQDVIGALIDIRKKAFVARSHATRGLNLSQEDFYLGHRSSDAAEVVDDILDDLSILIELCQGQEIDHSFKT